MSTLSLSSAGAHPLKSFCSLRSSISLSHSAKSAEELTQRIDRIVNRDVLCPHTPEQLLLLYRNVEQTDRETLQSQAKEVLSSLLVERVQNAIRAILTLPSDRASSRDLINLYYLSQFPPLTPPSAPITNAVLEQRRSTGGDFTPVSIAKQLPYCISKEHFLHDLHLLTGLDPNSSFEVIQQPIKLLERDAELRARRSAFLEQRGSADYPPYLDQLLEDGFLYAYDYFLGIAECVGEGEYRKEIWQFGAAEISRIVLDVRHAIVAHVKRIVKKDHPNVVFLVGSTGSGKSTIAALLQGKPLERKGDRYEVPGHHTINRSMTTPSTFLPNVHVNPECVYIDFPGFDNVHGELIDLSIELAFKALVTRHRPKIVVVGSIKVLEYARGAHIRDLGKKFTRMLGRNAPLTVFLTQYIGLAEDARLENALIREKETQEKIVKLEDAVSQREKTVESLNQKLRDINGEDEKKIDKNKRKIRSLERDIAELEDKKRQGPLTAFEEKALNSLLRKLPKQREKLQQVKQHGTNSREQQQLNTQIQRELERIKRDQDEILSSRQELRACYEVIDRSNKELQSKHQEFLQLLGVSDIDYHVAELRDLEDPSTLTICKKLLSGARPIESTHKKLSDHYRAALVDQFKRAFTEGGVPPPPLAEIDDLQQRILETSLTAVLTNRLLPEVGAFLHLPEMDPECVEELDRHIVKGFSDALVRLIIIGSLKKEPKEDVIKNFIEKQITSMSNKQAEEASRLQKKWQSLKERVLTNSKSVAVNWESLEQHYQSLLTKTLAEIDQRRKQNLKEWDRWTACLLGVEGMSGSPRLPLDGKIGHSANQLAIKEIEELIESLDNSFDKIQELQYLVENKREIKELWQECTDALGDPVNFKKRLLTVIYQTRQIYDKGSKWRGTWADRIEKIGTKLHTSMASFYSMLRINSWLVNLMQAELCNQAESNQALVYQLSHRAFLGEIIGKSAPRVIIETAARSVTKGLSAGGRLSGQEALARHLVAYLTAQLAVKMGAETVELMEQARRLITEQALRTEVAETATQAARWLLTAQALAAERVKLAERTAQTKRADLGEKTEAIEQTMLEEGAELAAQAAAQVGRMGASIAPMLTERAAELKELVKANGLLQKEEVLEALVAVTGVRMEKLVAEAERLLELKKPFEEGLPSRVRAINRALASRAGLNLDISLHKILLLDFLTVDQSPDGKSQ